MKIGNKLIVMIIALTLLGISVLLGTILMSAQKQISSLTASDLENLANNEAGSISLWLETHFGVARSLAHAMEAYEQIEPAQRRFFYNILLKQLTEVNPEILGIWTCWPSGALDGLDAQYANTEGTDSTGRFIPYWFWTETGVELTPLVDYEISGSGDFYLIPLQTGKETILEPYVYVIDGADTLLTSLAVPIKKNGQVVGVAG
ncbi:MAG: cache domain-containing protein, partial [Treponema sp.]|nr:cache domain-containing protein [Treponema sp.]